MYSQNNEEDLILKAVGGKVGTFLDIGANDGVRNSNTRALVAQGWSGVSVEADPATFQRLVANLGDNPKLTLVNAAIGLEPMFTKFWHSITEDGLSTTEEEQYDRRKARATFARPFYMTMVPLASLLREFKGPYDVVSIDIEGTSGPLFCAWPFIYHRPKVVIVEHDGYVRLCKGIAEFWDYKVVGENPENLVLVR